MENKSGSEAPGSEVGGSRPAVHLPLHLLYTCHCTCFLPAIHLQCTCYTPYMHLFTPVMNLPTSEMHLITPTSHL